MRRAARTEGRGIALVIVLWLLAALSLLAGAFAVNARTEATVAINAYAAARARALADGGIAYGIARLLARAEVPAEAWQVDGVAYPVAVAGATVEVSLAQETGKFDVNVIADDILANLLVGAGVAPADVDGILAALADYRDADDAVRLGGAEAAEYQALGLPYGPKNRLLESIDELAMIPGVTTAVFRAVRPALTVHTGLPRIDPATSPREALLAVPEVTPAEVDGLLAVRRENQYSETKQAFPALGGGEEWLAPADAPVFTVRARAVVPGGAVFVREAVVWTPPDGDDPYWLLDWTRGGGS
ncbi:MAG: hypothetical protein WD673_06450 [Alphaproteobacteria bacterium]